MDSADSTHHRQGTDQCLSLPFCNCQRHIVGLCAFLISLLFDRKKNCLNQKKKTVESVSLFIFESQDLDFGIAKYDLLPTFMKKYITLRINVLGIRTCKNEA